VKDLKLSLIVEALDKATAPLKKIGGAIAGLEGKIHGFNEKFKKLAGVEAIGGAALVGGIAAVSAGVFELTKHFAEVGEHAELTSQKVGIGAVALQRFEFAAKAAGVGAEALDTGTRMFAMHIAAAARGSKAEVRSLAEFGVTVKDIHGNLRPMKDLLGDVADAFSKMPDGAIKTDAAMKLFGRSGADLIPLLNKGRAQIDAWGDAAEKMGLVINEDGIKKAAGFNLALKNLQGAIEGLRLKLGGALVQSVTTAMNTAAEFIKALSPKAIDAFTKGLNELIKKMPAMAKGLANIAQLGIGVISFFLTLASNSTALNAVLITLAGFMSLQFVAAVMEGVNALKALKVVAAVGFIWDMIAGFAALVPSVGLVDAAMMTLNAVMALNPIGLIIIAIGVFIGLAAVVIANWKPISAFFVNLWKSSVDALKTAWSGVTGFFSNLMSGIENIFSNAWKRITAGMPDWLKTVIKVGGLATLIVTNPAVGVAATTAAVSHAISSGAPKAMQHGAGAAGANGRIDAHIHVTSEGKAQVKSLRASPGMTATVDRGTFHG
jgi:hypothetical protein